MKRIAICTASVLCLVSTWSFGQLFRITVTPSEAFGVVYWNDAYVIKMDGLSITGIDVRFVLPQGNTQDFINLWTLNSNGVAVQPVTTGTTPGTYKITHIKKTGTSTWKTVPHVRITIIGQTLPAGERAMHAQSRLIPRGSGYALHFPNMPNSSIDVRYKFNEGTQTSLYNVWQTDAHGIAYQPVTTGTNRGTNNFTYYKGSTEGTWRSTGGLKIYVVDSDAVLQSDSLVLGFDKTAGGVLFWLSQRKHSDVNLLNESWDRGREVQGDLIDGYVGPGESFRYNTINPTHAAGNFGQNYVP